MKKQIKETMYGFVLAVILLGGANFVYAQSWSATWNPAPSQVPPASTNVPAPINTGPTTQIKNGSFIVSGTFTTLGNILMSGGLRISTGAGNGKVLTSNATGVATWQELPAACVAASN